MLMSDGELMRQSKAGGARRSAKSHDEERGPALVFSDPTQSIYLADMTGDGLTDVVRIRAIALGQVSVRDGQIQGSGRWRN
jgi:hypothetical protein